MHDFLFAYGLFLAKTLTGVAALTAVIVLIAATVRAARGTGGTRLEVRHLNRRLEDCADALNAELLAPVAFKRYAKKRKAETKARDKSSPAERPRLFVLDFVGDMQASVVASLREEISALFQVVRPGDEVLLRIESPGGAVPGYGLAASQLRRIRDRGLKLTVSVDKVAASGGYLMASVATHIIAAPFAIVGSIGVVGALPNFNRLLRDNKIDYELHTAGDYKRTLTLFGENTEEGRAKFREELQQTHVLFKRFVAENRPQLALEPVATGEYWYGTQALGLGLVDTLKTSDDWLLDAAREMDVYELRYRRRRDLRRWLRGGLDGRTGLLALLASRFGVSVKSSG